MTNEKFLMRAIDITRKLGIHDRTISRWALKGNIKRFGRGEYCLISVFKFYRQQLLEEKKQLKQKISEISKESQVKSLQQQKLEASIDILDANIRIKLHDYQKLKEILIDQNNADKVYTQACAEFRNQLERVPLEIADKISNLSDPNLINDLLQNKINSLLEDLAI